MGFSVLTGFGFFNVILDDGQVGFLANGKKVAAGVTALSISEKPEFLEAKTQRESEISELLLAWGNGDMSALNMVPVVYPNSEFRNEVSIAMRQIPAGSVLSYAELAAAAGNPKAVRAAASVCSRNPIPIVIPCHRIIRSDGSLGNYFYGVELKDKILRHEQFLCP